MEALGIDVKLFIAQIINFLILLLILWRFAYKPIVKMLEDRRQKVAQSMQNAKDIEEKLTATEQKTKELIDKARQDASTLLEENAKAAAQEKKGIIAAAKEQSAKEIDKAKAAILEEKELAQKALQAETARLVSLATEKILQKSPDPAVQKQAIEEAIGEIE